MADLRGAGVSTIAHLWEVISCLRKGRRTQADVREYTGLSEQTVAHYIAEAHASGNVRIVGARRGLRGKTSIVYEWQDVPYALPDDLTTNPQG